MDEYSRGLWKLWEVPKLGREIGKEKESTGQRNKAKQRADVKAQYALMVLRG